MMRAKSGHDISLTCTYTYSTSMIADRNCRCKRQLDLIYLYCQLEWKSHVDHILRRFLLRFFIPWYGGHQLTCPKFPQFKRVARHCRSRNRQQPWLGYSECKQPRLHPAECTYMRHVARMWVWLRDGLLLFVAIIHLPSAYYCGRVWAPLWQSMRPV
jgi:hypothetical protein